MQGPCEIVQPGSVIGVVTGVVREGIHLSFDQSPRMLSAAVNRAASSSRIRTAAVQSMTQSIRVLTRFSPFRSILATLFRWTATIDAFTPAPLQSLPSLSKVASFTLRMFPHMAGLLAASIEQKPTRYIIRLGSWRLAQYDPTTETTPAPPISPRRRSGVDLSANLQCVSKNLAGAEKTFSKAEVRLPAPRPSAEHSRRMLKKSVQQGRSDEAPEAYPLGYVEDADRSENDAGRTFSASCQNIHPFARSIRRVL